ncbi:MAG TPA: hypothetical protein VIO14_12280 [Dehalococcoidia bacterium]
MAMIEERDAAYLREQFQQRLADDVTIDYFTQHQSVLTVPGQECAYCAETGQILEELAALTPKLHVVTHDFVAERELAERLGVDKIPALIFRGKNKGAMRYFGIPSGYEFATLVEDVIDASTGEHGLSRETAAWLSDLDRDLHIQVFVTPT